MASAWGSAWGLSWGNAWGVMEVAGYADVPMHRLIRIERKPVRDDEDAALLLTVFNAL